MNFFIENIKRNIVICFDLISPIRIILVRNFAFQGRSNTSRPTHHGRIFNKSGLLIVGSTENTREQMQRPVSKNKLRKTRTINLLQVHQYASRSEPYYKAWPNESTSEHCLSYARIRPAQRRPPPCARSPGTSGFNPRACASADQDGTVPSPRIMPVLAATLAQSVLALTTGKVFVFWTVKVTLSCRCSRNTRISPLPELCNKRALSVCENPAQHQPCQYSRT